jgi:uncharacterized membrane protein YdjX (TVP38/TMEM64 family)
VVLGLIAYWALGGPSRFSLEELQARREEWKAWVDANYCLAILAFVGVAAAGTALCLPVTSVLCLAAGAFFEFGLGSALVSFSTTLGATCAFLMTRHLFHELVQERWGRRLEAMHRGLEREGSFYLFSLRLVPVAPFFLVNALAGLTRIRVRGFWWATQLGMLPLLTIGTYAGTELSRIRQLSDVLTPPVLLSLALLGTVPPVLRLLVAWTRGRRTPVAAGGEKDHRSLPKVSEEFS